MQSLNPWLALNVSSWRQTVELALKSTLPNEMDAALLTLLEMSFHQPMLSLEADPALYEALLGIALPAVNAVQEAAQGDGAVHEGPVVKKRRVAHGSTLTIEALVITENEPVTRATQERVLAVVQILHNLSQTKENNHFLGADRTIRDLILWGLSQSESTTRDSGCTSVAIRWFCLALLEQMAYCIPLDGQGRLLSQLRRCLTDISADRAYIIHALRILSRFSMLEANESPILKYIDSDTLHHVVPLLLLHRQDSELVEAATDFLYRYSSIASLTQGVKPDTDAGGFFAAAAHRSKTRYSNAQAIHSILNACQRASGGGQHLGSQWFLETLFALALNHTNVKDPYHLELDRVVALSTAEQDQLAKTRSKDEVVHTMDWYLYLYLDLN